MKKPNILLTSLVVIIASFNIISIKAVENMYQPETIPTRYEIIKHVASYLRISGTTGRCDSEVIGKNGVNRITIHQKLQRYSGGEWTTVQLWRETTTSTSLSFSNTKGSLSSGTYRNHTVAYVYKNNDREVQREDSVEYTIR